LPEGVVETFNVIGFPGFLRDGLVSSHRNHALIGVILIRMERGLLTVYQRDLGPQFFGIVATAIPDVKRHGLAGGGVHGDPNPLPVGLLLRKAPHLIGFGFQPWKHHVGWAIRELNMSVIRTGGKALHHKVQEPRETDTHRPTDPAQGNALAQQMLNERALLVRNEVLFGVGHKLASACLALMILFAAVNMAVFLELAQPTPWARVSDNYGCCWPPS
jgi:hypothetical protein